MNNYINFLDKQKYKIILLTTLLVATLSISLKDIAFEGSYRIWFDKDSSIIKNYDKFRKDFSGDDTFIVAFQDSSTDGVFNKKAVDTIINLTDEFESIDGVDDVSSLSNYSFMSDKNDNFRVDQFLEDYDNLESKKQTAIKDNLIVNQLISKDGKSTAIAIRLDEVTGVNEEVNIFVYKEILKITNSYQKDTNYKFYISGTPAITASLVIVSQRDAMILMPLAVVIVVILLFFLFRSFMGVLVPSVVVIFTFLCVLSIQMILGYKLNNFTVNIPSFVSAIAIADAIHLYLAWVYFKLQNHTNKESVNLALKYNILPIALTSLTTSIGFATLGLSTIEPISTLGIAITCASFLAFIFSITIAPAILLTLSDQYEVKPLKFLNLLNTEGYGAFIVRNDKKIVGMFVILFAVLGYGLTYTKVDSNSIKYFAEDTKVRSGSTFIEDKITGAMIYEVIINSGKKDGIKDIEFLKAVIKFEKQLYANFPNIRFSTSIKDILIRMQKVLNPNSTQQLPQTQNLIAQYLLLYNMNLPQGKTTNDKIDSDYSKIRLSINSNIQDTSKDLEMIEWIDNWWENESGTIYRSEVQGQTTIFAYMQSSVSDTLMVSIGFTLLIVVSLMLVIFKNIKMTLLFILPNIAPILLVAGFMGYMDLTIDIGVAISAAVILGIAVDDSIHFFSKYFKAIKSGKSFEQRIDYVIKHSANAMILTTFILSFTFAVFTFSSFVPNINFAIVTVTALNIALLLDLVLLPALLSLGRRK
ncbi:MAG: MMPL family transporter [Campylobacterota bacterium]|nr:MMPL family transporter [Campylobacterota bacterium]